MKFVAAVQNGVRNPSIWDHLRPEVGLWREAKNEHEEKWMGFTAPFPNLREAYVEGEGHIRCAYMESDRIGGISFELIEVRP